MRKEILDRWIEDNVRLEEEIWVEVQRFDFDLLEREGKTV